MRRFFLEELRTKCQEICTEGSRQEMIAKVIEAYDRILEYANVFRKEGLLALEECIQGLDRTDETQDLLYRLVLLVVDGTEPELVRTVAANSCVSMNLPSYLGLINLMYSDGAIMIQCGDLPWVIDATLKSMMPKIILDELKQLRDIEE